jgi:hypothetical protein
VPVVAFAAVFNGGATQALTKKFADGEESLLEHSVQESGEFGQQ